MIVTTAKVWKPSLTDMERVCVASCVCVCVALAICVAQVCRGIYYMCVCTHVYMDGVETRVCVYM